MNYSINLGSDENAVNHYVRVSVLKTEKEREAEEDYMRVLGKIPPMTIAKSAIGSSDWLETGNYVYILGVKRIDLGWEMEAVCPIDITVNSIYPRLAIYLIDGVWMDFDTIVNMSSQV